MMHHISFVWIGEPQTRPILNPSLQALFPNHKFIYHDTIGPLSLVDHDKKDVTIHFFCLREHFEYYNNFFKNYVMWRDVSSSISVHSCEDLIDGISKMLKPYSDCLKLLQQISPGVHPDSIITPDMLLAVWRRCQPKPKDLLEELLFYNFAKALQNGFGFQPCRLKILQDMQMNLNYIWNYSYQFFSFLRKERLSPLRSYDRYNNKALYVNMKHLISFIVLFYLGGYFADSNVCATAETPNFFPVSNFKCGAFITSRIPFFRMMEVDLNRVISGLPRNISLIYNKNIITYLDINPALDADNETHVNADVWFMSSPPYDSGAYQALVTFTKLTHWLEMETERNDLSYGKGDFVLQYSHPMSVVACSAALTGASSYSDGTSLDALEVFATNKPQLNSPFWHAPIFKTGVRKLKPINLIKFFLASHGARNAF